MGSPFPLGFTPVSGTMIGAQSVSAEQAPSTNGGSQDLVSDLVGKLIVLPYANPENFVSGTGVATSVTTNVQALPAASGVLRNYVTNIVISNSSATATEVVIKDGTTALMTIAAPVGGQIVSLQIPLRGSAATALNFATLASVASVKVSVTGYVGQ